MEETVLVEDTRKSNILLFVLLSICFSFNLFVFAPLEGYLSNVSEFWFGLTSVLPIIILVFLLSVAIIFDICFALPKKIRMVIVSLIFSASVGLYIQGNFLTAGYPILNGEPIDWDSMTQKGLINTLIWVGVFILPFILMCLKPNIFKAIVKIGSIVIIGIEVVTLSTMLFGASLPADSTHYLSTENQFELSKKENIVVFVSDTFESSYMTRAIEEFPELQQDLQDFTYYDNTTGISTFTYLSCATLLTGNIFPIGADANTGMVEAFQDTDFYDVMHENHYEVNLYTDERFMRPEYTDKVDNLVNDPITPNDSAVRQVSKLLYKFSFFKYAPHYLKSAFVIDINSFGAAQGEMNRPIYYFDDVGFRNTFLSEGIQNSAEKNQFVMYHLNGIHAPNNLDRNLQSISYPEDVPYNDRRYEQTLGQIKLLKEYIAELKKAGTYDNTTIIFTADHGHQNRFNPVLMVKPSGATSDFKISHAPISLVEDYIPFIQDLAAGMGLSSAFYAIPEDSKRERYVYNFVSTQGYAMYNSSYSKIAVNGLASDLNSYSILSDEFTPDISEKEKYQFGDKILLDNSAQNAKVYGFSNEKNTYTKTAAIEIQCDKPPTADVTVKLKIDKVYGDHQRLIAQSSGVALFNDTVKMGVDEVSFTVPVNLFESGKLVLDLQFPNTIQDNSDTASLGWVKFQSFIFDYITFSV